MLLLPSCFFFPFLFSFKSVALSVRVSGESTSPEIWTESIRVLLWAPSVCWWTWMSSLSCKLLSFIWTPIPLTWMHFYIAYIVISSSHLVWSCVSAVLCRAGRHLSTTKLQRGICSPSFCMGRAGQRVRIQQLKATVCVLSLIRAAVVCPICLWRSELCLFVNERLITFFNFQFSTGYCFSVSVLTVCLWRLSVA